MHVIPGSQKEVLHATRERTDVENVLTSSMDENLVDESQAVDIVLAAGDVSIHHPNIIHGSEKNASPNWRNGLTIRYIPTTTRVLSEHHPIHMRGAKNAHLNTYDPFPKYREGEHMKFRDSEAWQ